MVMARKEVEEMKKKLQQFQIYVRKKKTLMRADIEEIEIRISEVHESREAFESEVVTEGVDPITGKIVAERVMRWLHMFQGLMPYCECIFHARVLAKIHWRMAEIGEHDTTETKIEERHDKDAHQKD